VGAWGVAGQRQGRLSFGTFALDRESSQLLKRGLPFRVQEKPLQLLSLLLEHPGEIVSREDLQRRLWPNGTYVDFDKGLNTAVKKLRYALGDSPDNPVFIETIPRRGYRFIAPVSGNGFLPEEPPAGEPIFRMRRTSKNPVTLAPNLICPLSSNRPAPGDTGTY